ncbi:DUF58 domain-containing protein [Lutispora thermophila]|uniref:Uncharacterized protein n=1 Tax=Lutispora thermophila DSM 19022 TaxID=1122184 RepID=A0A1M6H2X6_9FIRM|nr:DUF58 domain-containing protein [Lutispora thermophila]SHJ16492.1 Protein of unknown function DUF58 [Lutispora thermophila DSM 19022]
MIYVLVFLILIGFALNYLSRKYVLHNLDYSREISKKVVEVDEEFEISTIIENRKLLPVTFLQVVEKYPSVIKFKFKTSISKSEEHLFHRTTMMLLPYQRVKRSVKVSFGRRGRMVLRDVILLGGDLLGFHTATKELKYLQEIVVLPKKTSLDDEILPYGNYYGDISVKRWIIDDPLLTVGIREYTGSEPMKSIHWPSSLRTGALMVKQLDFTTDNTVMIALNIECSKPFWSGFNIGYIERCISITREVMERFEEAGIPYGLVSNARYSGALNSGSTAGVGYGRAHYNNLVENLGRIEYSITMTFDELLDNMTKDSGSYTTYVIITPVMLKDYIDVVNILSNKSMRMVVISLHETNLEYLKDGIIAYVGRKE